MASNTRKSNLKVIIIMLIIVLCLFAGSIISNYFNRIPDNDPYLVGNTAGNLNNSGLFCESDGKVYFSNVYDSGALYSMTPDQQEIKKLYASSAKYINAGGKYLYFAMESLDGGTGLGYILKTSGIYRIKNDGKNLKCISNDMSLVMVLSGNDLYYQAATGAGVGLKKCEVTDDEKDEETVVNTFVLNPACVVDGTIYFGGTEKDHYLYSLNTANNNISTLWGGDVWNPVYDGGYFYFMDISNNYKICRFSPSTQTVDILTHDRADTFNVGYGYIYYSTSTSKNPGLYRMRIDGSNPELIQPGYICDINMTSTYTYYREFDNPKTMYYVATAGSPVPSEFVAASKAIE